MFVYILTQHKFSESKIFKVQYLNAQKSVLPELGKVCPQFHDIPAETLFNVGIFGSDKIFQRRYSRERCPKHKANVHPMDSTNPLGKKIRTVLEKVQIGLPPSLENKKRQKGVQRRIQPLFYFSNWEDFSPIEENSYSV